MVVRHALAGKEVRVGDLKFIFGRRVFSLLAKKDIGLFMRWLRANQRTELNFKPSNPFLIELALQKIYAFWPMLMIKLLNKSSKHGK